MTNEMMATQLRLYAHELEQAGANLFRARAFRTAASAVQMLPCPVAEVFAREGRAGLERLPGIGISLAYTVEKMLQTGELESLRPADVDPHDDWTTVPGVGPRLAEGLRERLGVESLGQLHEAVEQGRLAEVGVGPKRLAGIRAEVERRLLEQVPPRPPVNEPPLSDLLAVDEEYRRRIEEEDLPLIAPRFFNPERDRWLGVLRTERNGWRYRVLFSNTALAHRLGRTRDWVVIYFEKGDVTGQRTVVTETRGAGRGRRVVRGREAEMAA